ncbi:MAG: hypothetical protein RL088_2401 [Verrucomicrobiota bacterium]|jgi:hypothetical protein
MKNKGLNEAMFLALLEKVLPKATKDPHLANTIYEEVAKEVRLAKNLQAFDKFCEDGALPNIEPDTMQEFECEMASKFGEENVEITPDEEGKKVAVEITLPDRTVTSEVRVDATIANEEEIKVPFVPFPVSLPEDPELVWAMARREDLGPDEASRALAEIEAEFWETKKGLELQKKRVEKCFAEFIVHVPASALKDSGLKRHYKTPESLKTIRLLPAAKPKKEK